MADEAPFWNAPLETLDRAQWEALCDGCGKCCLHKVEDEDTGRIYPTNVACKLLDLKTNALYDAEIGILKDEILWGVPLGLVAAIGKDRAIDVIKRSRFLGALTHNAELALIRADLDVARAYAALAQPADASLFAQIEVEHARTRALPVVVLTTSDEPFDIEATYALGVNSYIRKPVDFEQFVAAVKQIGLYWLVLNQPRVAS